MNTKRWRLALAGLLIGSVAVTTTDAFIFRRMRSRISSGRGAFSSRQSRGMGMLFRRRSSSSSSSRSSRGPVSSGRNAKWNVEGQWSYNTEFLAQHLQQIHGVDTTGMTRDQMQQAHDNCHNGVKITSGLGPIQAGGPCDGCPLQGCCPSCVLPKNEEVVEAIVEQADVFTIIEEPRSSCPSGACPSSRGSSSSSSCPSGKCPSSRGSSSTRRRGLFRR